MTDERTPPDGPRDLAAEYALGVLTGAELLKARELERTDAGFRDEVARWTGRLAPLLDEVDGVAPPDAAWAAIQKRVGPSASNDNMVALSRKVARWRGIAGGMTAVAACLSFALIWTLPRTQTQPAPIEHSAPTPAPAPAPAPMVAILGDQGQAAKVVASWDPAAHQLVLAVAGDMKTDENHSHELWVIPKGGKPSSLGTMSASRQMHMRLAQTLAKLLENGATIAISVEPRGGSPTGAPTGPVIASGALTQA
jgi:anti-sigma-K factor RskA